MENYEKKYKDALERAKKIVNDQNASSVWKGWLCNCFPELKESEDDRIRKCICLCLEECVHNDIIRDYEKDKCLAWLEKQGEQKPADKVEPRFKVGDWVTCGELNTAKIVNIDSDRYEVEFIDGNKGFPHIDYVDRLFHLWTIQDAKDGDVLIYNHQQHKWIFIFKRLYSPILVSYYIIFTEKNKIYVDDSISTSSPSRITPATKEQRDTLFAKMKEAGYEWDVEKKELKKIENEIEIPFGAKDSELQEATYYIPKGFHGEIEGNKVVIKQGGQKTTWSDEDEAMLVSIISDFAAAHKSSIGQDKWLKSLKQRIGG